MKKMKIVACLLSVLMVALVGCSPKPAESAKEPISLTAGTYTASAKGNKGDVTVELTCTKERIESVKVVAHNETPEYIEKVLEALPKAIVDSQTLSIETVSGATISSQAIVGAAAQCIRDAGGNPRAFGYVPLSEVSEQQSFTIEGLAGGSKNYSGEELRTFEAIEADTISINASGEKNPLKCKGVTLEALLAANGTSQKNFGSVIISATDGYSIEIPAEVLLSRDVIIAYEADGEPCPPRTVVPNERAMYWVKFVEKIELMNPLQKAETTKVFLLETALLGCEQSDYKYGDGVDKAVMVGELFEKYLTQKSDFVELMSIDEWGKNDKYGLVAAQYLKVTGEYAPMFIGPDLPEGMRLKDTLFLKVGSEALLSAEMLHKKLEGPSEVQLSVSSVLEEVQLANAPSYTFAAADGYKVSVAKEDIAKGSITLGEDGATVRFEGLDKNTTVKQLLSITAEG